MVAATGVLTGGRFARWLQVSAHGEVTVALPPKLELHCPALAVANQSLEVTLVSWGSVGVDVDWKITKDGAQVAKGKKGGYLF